MTRSAIGAGDPGDEGDDESFDRYAGFRPDFGIGKIIQDSMRPVWQAQLAPINNILKGPQLDLGIVRLTEQLSRNWTQPVIAQSAVQQMLANLAPIYRQPLFAEQIFANLNRAIMPDLSPFFEALRYMQPSDLEVDDEDETEEQRQLREFLATVWSTARHYVSFEQFARLAPYLYLLAVWAGAIYVIAGFVGSSQLHEDKASKEYQAIAAAASMSALAAPTLKRRRGVQDKDDKAA